MRVSGSLKFLLLSLAVFSVVVLFLPYFIAPVHAYEPKLETILSNLGFSNITLTDVETWSAGTYNITLYAEFAGWYNINELSYYELNASDVFNVIFNGPEGASGNDYVKPPLSKLFTANYEFGLSMLSKYNNRYFTNTSRNGDGKIHSVVYENLNDSGMYLIGFENTWGGGDEDFNDMVFSIKPYAPTVEYYLTVETDPASIVTIPGEGWYDNCTYVNLTAPEFVPVSGVRYRFDYWDVDDTPKGTGVNSITVHMDANHTATAHYVAQYYLTVISPYDTPGGKGWYDNCTYANATLLNGVVDHGNGTQRVFINWTGDASGTNYAQSDPIHMDQNKTAVANWKTQYYLTLTTNPPSVTTPSGEGWYDDGTYASISTDEFVDITPGASRYRFNGWTTADMNEIANASSPSTTVLMDKPKTVTANYIIQYNVTFSQSGVGTDFTGTVVTIDSAGYGVGDLPKSFWWDNGTDHSFSFASPLLVDGDKQYVWTSTTGLSILQTGTLTITSSGSVTGNYETQYKITFDQTGVGSDFTGVVVVIDSTDYYVGDLLAEFWWDAGSSHDFVFQSPLEVTPDAKQYVWTSTSGLSLAQSGSITVSTSGSIVGNYKTQYYLTVSSAHGTTGSEGWYDTGDTAYATVTPLTVPGTTGVQYVFTQWSEDASGNTSPSEPITMNGPKTAVANWKTQYYLTVTSPYDTPTPTSGWFDAGTPITASVTSPWPGTAGTQYVCTGWTGTGSVPASGSAASVGFTINEPSSITWTWKTQYYLTVKTDPTGLSPAPTPSSGWHDEGTNVQLTAPDPSYKGSVEYSFKHWKVDGTQKGTGVKQIAVLMDKSHTATAYYQGPEIEPVGGHIAPISIAEEPPLQPSPISLIPTLLAAIAISTILIRSKRKRALKTSKTP